MSRALRSLASLVPEWWPSEGTLISLMRYGKGIEQLPSNYDVAAGGADWGRKYDEKWLDVWMSLDVWGLG